MMTRSDDRVRACSPRARSSRAAEGVRMARAKGSALMRITAAAAVLVAVLTPVTIWGATARTELRCWTDDASDMFTPTMVPDDKARNETAASTITQSTGWLFEGSDEQEVQCTWIVADNYDAEGDPPQVRFMGWPIDNTICPGSPCPAYGVEFWVASRSYYGGQTANEAWSTDTVLEVNPSEVVCGGSKCIPPDVVESFVIDATDATNNWAQNQLVFIRIRREESIGNVTNLPADFHVAAIFLDYPIP